MTLKVGDVARNPKGGHNCVIVHISPPGEHYHEGYFVLSPLTKQGWPSISERKWQYRWHKYLDRLHQVGKYPHVETCPECSKQVKTPILDAPLRVKTVYDDQAQCKRCKRFFERRIR